MLELGQEQLTLDPGPGLNLELGKGHSFRLLRPEDLVALDVRAHHMHVISDDAGIALVPNAAGARLEVRYTFQHAIEVAEPEMTTPPQPHTIPIQARAARGSRLVYAVAATERIEYSVAGVLAAMSRLPLIVVPLALPRMIVKPLTTDPDAVTAVLLPGGIRLLRTPAGLVLAPVGRERGSRALGRGPGLIASATALRTARALMADERPVDLSGLEFHVGGAAHDDLSVGDVVFRPPIVRPIRQDPRSPRADETAIEAPFRLLLSPSDLGGFAHATTPVAVPPDPSRPRDPERIELWHSRLGVRRVRPDGAVRIDETRDAQKIVRAVWARDLDQPAPTPPVEFLSALDPENRQTLVRQSADPRIAPPKPVETDRLYLSALGAWLELHGRWEITPYATEHLPSIEAWDHEATSGRDQYVRVVEPYYLFPFGHRANLTTITERKITDEVDPQARLYQRKFLTITEPVRGFADRTMPFLQVRIRPLLTPNLDFQLPPPPGQPPNVAGSVGTRGDDLFWPMVDGAKYGFVLDALDHDGRRVIVRAPLLAVAAELGTPAEKTEIIAAYALDNAIPADGQSVAMAQSTLPGDTAFETSTLRFTGDPGSPGQQTSAPHLVESDIVVPAMRHLAPSSDPVTVSYADAYLTSGFTGSNASAQVLLGLKTATQISFGGGTDKAGGFVQPDLPMRGLSRAIGIVGDAGWLANPPSQAAAFNPTAFLDGVLPKLFGLFALTEILETAGLDQAPSFVTEQLDRVAAMVADLDDLSGALQRAVDRLTDDATALPTTALKAQAADARDQLAGVHAEYGDRLTELHDALDELMALSAPSDLPAVTSAVSGLLGTMAGFVTELGTTVRTVPLPPAVKAELERLVGALGPVLGAAQTLEAITDFVNGLDPANLAVRATYQWRPTLHNYPRPPADPLFFVKSDGFVLSVQARASGADGVGVDVLAELEDFGLNLFPGASLLRMDFDRLAFRASTGRKPEVDVVFNGMRWQGVLGFIETLKELVPFDGFSDPPYLDVSPDGVTAGFDLALPSVAVGVFSLENISLGADLRVPFLGDALTVGFNFCTRDKPFRMTVMCIGGGGFVALRLSPRGLVVLEMALEAGASLSLNFGVASGSVSVMVGLYLRLEGEEGSLTGYLRIRGQVDVLGMISASITLELALKYEFATGKMVGRASITVEVEVLFFSTSVRISCERRLAGSNGDPTFAAVLGVPEDNTPIAGVPDAWAEYCTAFAGA
ncbi:MAG: hypothetical protein WCF36_10625 [Candidatus Nanopelagicales bacterium]